MTASNDRLLQLLHVVIDNYISKWEPIGSKFLATIDGKDIDYAPSTLRKYLQQLEEAWFVYQPYKSSGRIPTVQGLSNYLDDFIEEISAEGFEESAWNILPYSFDLEMARSSLRGITEQIGTMIDGVAVSFLSNDDYHFLGINNLLTEKRTTEFDLMKYIVDFIEKKKLVDVLGTKVIKRWIIYYTFVESDDNALSCVYVKLMVNNYDAIISIVGPSRVDYKKNLLVLNKLIWLMGR